MAKNTSSIRRTAAIKRRTPIKSKVAGSRTKREQKSGKPLKAAQRPKAATKKIVAKKPAARKPTARKRSAR